MDFEIRLLRALEDYFQTVESQKQRDANQDYPLQFHFQELDTLTLHLPPETDATLRHFMMRKSYEKALDFLKQRVDLHRVFSNSLTN